MALKWKMSVPMEISTYMYMNEQTNTQVCRVNEWGGIKKSHPMCAEGKEKRGVYWKKLRKVIKNK